MRPNGGHPMSDIVWPGDDATRAMLADTYWLTRASADDRLTLTAVDDMTPDHQRRLLDYLRRSADQLHWYARKAINDQFRRYEIGFAARAQLLRQLDIPPAEWLDDTALVRRLVQLVTPPTRGERRRRLPARLASAFGGRR